MNWLYSAYTQTPTWVDGLVACIIADYCVEQRHDSMTDICIEAESLIWAALRNKVDWEEALLYSPKWHEAYPECASE